MSKYVYRVGPWRFVYEGGRLADIFHDESNTALECIQACDYDWTTGTPHFDRDEYKRRCREWVEEHGQEYIVNALPYMRD